MSMDWSRGEDEEDLILPYSETQERARLFYPFAQKTEDPDEPEESEESEETTQKAQHKNSRKRKRKANFQDGKVSLHITGYSGRQSFWASELIHYFSLAHLKVAAKRFLKRSGIKKTRKARKRSQKKSQDDLKEEGVNDQPAV